MAMHDRSMMPIGNTLGNRFEVEAYLGQGGFGYVSQCRNLETGERVAIKVNKSYPSVVRTTRMEIAMLRRLRCLDPDTCNIIKWNGFFFDREQICLNFELLDQSLRDYLHERDYWGLPMNELKPIVHQLTTAFYHLHSLGIAHADLKPDNVMIVDRDQQPLRIKLIDFGLALPRSDFHPGLNMGTISYKAPELMLHAPFWEAIDMWSLGLTVAELAIGRPLYPGNTDYDVLRFIIQTQGQPEDEVLDLGSRTSLFFKSENNGWRFKTRKEFAEETNYYGKESRYFELSCLDEIEQLLVTGMDSQSDQRLLVDLIKQMLILNPEDRITPLEILQHPLFAQSILKRSRTYQALDKIEEVEDGTPEPSQQCSGYLNTGPEKCRVIQDNEEETSKVSQLSSSNQTVGPDNVHCGVENSPADTLSGVSQQCSDHQTAGSDNSRCRIESPSVDTGIKTPDLEEETSELSGQSSLYETTGPENFHCGVKSSPADTLSGVSQQCSDYQTAGSDNSQCRTESPSVDTGIKTPDFEEEISNVSQLSSSNQTVGPDSVHCGVKNSPADTLTEPSQQCSDHKNAGPDNSHTRVESAIADTDVEAQDPQEETLELSGQSSSDETVEPEDFCCRLPANTCKEIPEEETAKPCQQCSGYHTAGPHKRHCTVEGPCPDICIVIPDIKQTPEPSQQCSGYKTAGPDNRHCTVEGPCPDICIVIPDIKQTPEPSQQCSGYKTAGPDNRHCRVKGPCPDICIVIPDIKQTPEPSQQCSGYKTAGPDNRHCRVEGPRPDICIEIPDSEVGPELSTQSLVLQCQILVPENAECAVEIPSADEESPPAWIRGQQDVQPETNADNDGWLRRLVRCFSDTIYYYLPLHGQAATDQTPHPP